MSEKTDLSDREIEILKLVATGASNKEIAQKLFISSNTVKVHLRNIFAKIGVESRTEAAMYAVNFGLIKDQILTGAGSGATAQNNYLQQPVVGLAEPRETMLAGSVDLSQKVRTRWLWVGAAVILFILLLVVFGVWFISESFRGNQEVVINDDSNRWTTSLPITFAREGLALATFENQLYAIGGNSELGVTSSCDRYDPAINSWESLPDKPTPTSDIQAAVVGGKIFLPGGRMADNKVSAALEIYDPRQNVWTTGASLPEGRSAYGLAAFEGKLFLFGGWNGNEYVDTVYEYDPGLDRWTEKTPMEESPRGFLSAVEAGGKIYVIGGYDGKRPFQSLWIYSPELDYGDGNPWSKKSSLPAGRYKMGAAALADTLYIIGGTASVNDSQPMLLYNPQMDQWTVFDAPISDPWTSMGVSPLGNFIYAIGGQIAGMPTDQNKAYQAIYTILLPVVR